MTLPRQSAQLARVLFLALLVIACSASHAAAQATLTTDKADYYPGEVAILTGSGFAPGEEVAIQVLHHDATPDSGEAHAAWSVAADESGSFTTDWVVCGDDCLGSSLLATADGQTSGLHAEVAFTDSPKVGAVVVGPQSGSLCSGTAGSVSFAVTVKRGSGSGSSGNFLATMTTSGLPGTVTSVFTPDPIQIVSQADSASGTLTLTTTAATPGGTFAFRVKASTSASDTAGTAATLTINPGPAIICPANLILSNTAGLCARTNVTYTATATGSPAPTITFSPASGSTFPVGTTTVTATATNSCGSTSCTFNVTINDTEKPALTLPANITR
ncbi:MAG TPA: HYR domain-containing protein, partial [Candidatus Polarisedimenticolia bacterium]|nr:HYR domain-containing protein [Candidatus Polarisedimenticolia bacterium]